MDNFKAVYKILSSLEAQMDLEKANPDLFSPERLGVSQERWNKYIEMMADVGYIKGIKIVQTITGDTFIEQEGIQITLKGLEYLQENAIMRKLYNAARGMKEIVPGP